MHDFGLRLLALLVISAFSLSATAAQIALTNVKIAVDRGEPSYLHYGAEDLASHLTELTGQRVSVVSSAVAGLRASTVIAIGEKAAKAAGADFADVSGLSEGGSFIRSFERDGATVVAVAGPTPQGTNAGIATLLQQIRTEGDSIHFDGPLDLTNKPNYATRGLHLNGWPLKHPYAFRSWSEEEWKRFVDISWAQRINLVYIWPFMEIIPLPLSAADQKYLQEVQRVVDYAKKKRGMEVWIMQSANRVGVSDCGTADPRMRTYWVPRDCQQDMNPADPEQFARIMRHFDAFYRIVNNADGYCMIDSDPGGWPGSPLSDQTKIFNGARDLLDRLSVGKQNTKLIDWMWLGWGRNHTGEDSGDRAVAHMQETIRNFKANLREPWELISGLSPYLESAKSESALDKTVFLQYGAIEDEPAFPATNMGQKSILAVFETAAKYPGLKGVMGNNELMLLQFPRTFNFFGIAWDAEYAKRSERDVLLDLAQQLHPDHRETIADAFLALRETDLQKITAAQQNLSQLIASGNAGRPGSLSRLLFPDRLSVARNLLKQLDIRLARQQFITALQGTPSLEDSAQLLEDYFDKLLAWNEETGWSKMIDITIWRTPIYQEGRDLSDAMTRLKKVLMQGKPYMTYTQADDFFSGISTSLKKKYGSDSVMIGCVEPFKLALIQGW